MDWRSSSASDASPLISRFVPRAGSVGSRRTFAQMRQTFARARQSHWRWDEICKAAGSPWATVQGLAIAEAALLPPAKSSGLGFLLLDISCTPNLMREGYPLDGLPGGLDSHPKTSRGRASVRRIAINLHIGSDEQIFGAK